MVFISYLSNLYGFRFLTLSNVFHKLLFISNKSWYLYSLQHCYCLIFYQIISLLVSFWKNTKDFNSNTFHFLDFNKKICFLWLKNSVRRRIECSSIEVQDCLFVTGLIQLNFAMLKSSELFCSLFRFIPTHRLAFSSHLPILFRLLQSAHLPSPSHYYSTKALWAAVCIQ